MNPVSKLLNSGGKNSKFIHKIKYYFTIKIRIDKQIYLGEIKDLEHFFTNDWSRNHEISGKIKDLEYFFSKD